MWVKIKTQDGPNLSFPVPLSLAGSKLLLSLAAKNGEPQAAEYAPYAADIVRELREYVRRNGHFMLVDVERQNGDIVKIKVYTAKHMFRPGRFETAGLVLNPKSFLFPLSIRISHGTVSFREHIGGGTE